MPEQSHPLLDIRNLSIEAQSGSARTTIVDDVSFSLDRGEILGLIGESGAGKSTLGLAALGFVRDGCRITGGSITFDGIDLRRAGEPELRRLRGCRIAYVAQSAAASFNPAHSLMRQTAEAPLLHGLATRREAEAEAIRLYREMRLPTPEQIGWRYPHELSGGQLQRAMTAMAMICQPDLIVFDEPTTALDVTTQIEVLAAIREIVRENNVAAIYISHDLAIVAQMADRIKVLRHGREVEEAPTRMMLADPREEYTKSLWAVRQHERIASPPPTATTPLLDVRDIRAGYGSTPVLHGVGLEVYRSRTVAIVGESGSGKSTLARVITGILPPDSGEILLDGEKLPPRFANRSRPQLRAVQMIYQSADTALNPRQHIADILGYPLSRHLGLSGKRQAERVAELLDMVGLDPSIYARRYPGELSGGQKQRVGIARALAAEPQLIICDEVTSALDQIVAEETLRLLETLQSEFGISYLFISHDLATVRAIADNVIVMNEGRVVEAGPAARIFADPKDEYTKHLLAAVPEMDPDWLTEILAGREKKPLSLDPPIGS